jgi:hypothetical protein
MIAEAFIFKNRLRDETPHLVVMQLRKMVPEHNIPMSQQCPHKTSVLRTADEAIVRFLARCDHGVALVTDAANEIILVYRG